MQRYGIGLMALLIGPTALLAQSANLESPVVFHSPLAAELPDGGDDENGDEALPKCDLPRPDPPCFDNDLDGYGLGDCLGTDCNDDDGMCWMAGDACCAPGTGSCNDILLCAGNCGAAPTCIQDCIELGDAAAQGRFATLQTCVVNAGCTFDDFMCIASACGAQGFDCFNN